MNDFVLSDLTQVAQRAAVVLARHYGNTIHLSEPQIIKDATRAIVLRCRVQDTAAPNSVIVKVIRADPATGVTEWASLAFLAELPDAHQIVPAFLGSDNDARLFVCQDLGAGQTLHDVLMTSTPTRAREVLHQLAQQMARLHVATQGREDDFLRVRRAFTAEANGRQHEAGAWLAARNRVEAWFAATGSVLPNGFDACLEQIAATYTEPGAWLAFTHGDPAPSNNHIANQATRLLDFEYGAFRHALYDITAWNILCPLPLAAIHLMRNAFQAALTESFPLETFEQEWALLCAYRALALLTWVPVTVLEQNQPFVDAWTARHAVLAATTRAAQAIATVPTLAALGTALNDLHAALRRAGASSTGAQILRQNGPHCVMSDT